MAKSFAEILAGPLRPVATIVGAAAGFGVVAFVTGYLAQRAQHLLAGVPFVFIDYWSYAEVGLTGMLFSAYAVLSNVSLLAVIITASFGIVFLLEARLFRSMLDHAPLYLAVLLVLGGLLAVIVNQQLAVRALLHPAGPLDGGTAEGYLGPETVPVRWPFGMFVANRLEEPELAQFTLPASDLEGFEALADDLQRSTARGTRRLEVRPAPAWAKVDRDSRVMDLVGVQVSKARLDANRAYALQGAVLGAMLLAVWLTLLAELWGRRLKTTSWAYWEYQGQVGLHETIWIAGRWVIRPVVAVLLSATLVLWPECHGLLAMPDLGQEMVQVLLTEETGDGSPAGPQREEGSSDEGGQRRPDMFPGMSEALWNGSSIIERYPTASTGQQALLRDAWTDLLRQLQDQRDAESIQTLERLARMSLVEAPSLAEEARDAWMQAARGTATRRVGFLLHYPRSDASQLRLIERDHFSRGRPWIVSPIPIESVNEIRVSPDETTMRALEVLRGMGSLDPDERWMALLELSRIGHQGLLEFTIAASVSRSPNVTPPSITSIGRLASVLPDTPDGRLRRRRAITALVSYVQTEDLRADWRGGAATALQMAAPAEDSQACACLTSLFGPEASSTSDPHWELRGTALTSLGLLRCPGGEPILIEKLGDQGVQRAPDHVRGAIPTALTNYDAAIAVPVLARLVADVEQPAQVTGPALTALGILGPRRPDEASAAIAEFLERTDRDQKREIEELVGAAIGALALIGDRDSFEVLRWLVERRDAETRRLTEPLDTRRSAVQAIGALELPPAAKFLWSLARNSHEAQAVRVASVEALGELNVERIVPDLIGYYKGESNGELKNAALAALEMRAEEGSGVARNFVEAQNKARPVLAPQLPSTAGSGVAAPPSQVPDLAAPGVAAWSVQQSALAHLRAGSVDSFLELMSEDYFDNALWSTSILPLFPDYDESLELANEGISADLLADPAFPAWALKQDLLARWVLENRFILRWNAAAEIYERART